MSHIQSAQTTKSDSAEHSANDSPAKDVAALSRSAEATPRSLQLLAPARDADTAIVAIDHGADAVYMGAPSHGARAAAANSIEDIRRACQYAHRYAARIYVTVNTIIYDDELDDVQRMVWELYRAGVDALIVQDMSLLRMDLPPIALHASTQCDIRTPQKARFLAQAGFGQIVLPRELSLDDIRRYAREVPRGTSLEAFVHGALCVCYSGDCRASLVAGGRSANRGCCAQMCRLPYDLVDADGHVLIRGRHLLSLRDLNRMSDLAAMADAGISSFKIEGRLKSASYVANVTAAYSQALNAVIAASNGRYRRASAGISVPAFEPDVTRAFNRGFTRYFIDGTMPGKGETASWGTPKFVGVPVARVAGGRGPGIRVHTDVPLANGDGLGYFDDNREYRGFRVNRVSSDSSTIFPAGPVEPLRIGTVLYRNYDKAFEDALASGAERRIPITMSLRRIDDNRIALDVKDSGRSAAVTAVLDEVPRQQARTPQDTVRASLMSRLGDTIYTLAGLEDALDSDEFVPAKALTALRRHALEMQERDAAAVRPIETRRADTADVNALEGRNLTFHDNVANDRAREFYKAHGAAQIEPAMEIDMPDGTRPVRVMTCCYCLRREMGACLRTPEGTQLPRQLYLRPISETVSASVELLRLTFDCAECRMHVDAMPKSGC